MRAPEGWTDCKHHFSNLRCDPTVIRTQCTSFSDARSISLHYVLLISKVTEGKRIMNSIVSGTSSTIITRHTKLTVRQPLSVLCRRMWSNFFLTRLKPWSDLNFGLNMLGAWFELLCFLTLLNTSLRKRCNIWNLLYSGKQCTNSAVHACKSYFTHKQYYLNHIQCVRLSSISILASYMMLQKKWTFVCILHCILMKIG